MGACFLKFHIHIIRIPYLFHMGVLCWVCVQAEQHTNGGMKCEYFQKGVSIRYAKTGKNTSPVRYPADHGDFRPDGPFHLESIGGRAA